MVEVVYDRVAWLTRIKQYMPKTHANKQTNYILPILPRIDTKTTIVALWRPPLKRAAVSEKR